MSDAPTQSVKSTSPWAWIPTLYFAEGIPYVIVMNVSVTMYKRLGISNTDIALYTSWLYLPWVIKPLWSPLVDLLGTKRHWVVLMQAVIAVSLAMVALELRVQVVLKAQTVVMEKRANRVSKDWI